MGQRHRSSATAEHEVLLEAWSNGKLTNHTHGTRNRRQTRVLGLTRVGVL